MSVTEGDYIDLYFELERLKGAIPAYVPCPCDCIEKREKGYQVDCQCGNPGDFEVAIRWAERTEIIEQLDAAIDAAMRECE